MNFPEETLEALQNLHHSISNGDLEGFDASLKTLTEQDQLSAINEYFNDNNLNALQLVLSMPFNDHSASIAYMTFPSGAQNDFLMHAKWRSNKRPLPNKKIQIKKSFYITWTLLRLCNADPNKIQPIPTNEWPGQSEQLRPIHIALENAPLDCIKLLLNTPKFTINATTSLHFNNTALHKALRIPLPDDDEIRSQRYQRRSDIIEELVQNGINVNAKNNKNQKALYVALRLAGKGDFEPARYLLEKGAGILYTFDATEINTLKWFLKGSEFKLPLFGAKVKKSRRDYRRNLHRNVYKGANLSFLLDNLSCIRKKPWRTKSAHPFLDTDHIKKRFAELLIKSPDSRYIMASLHYFSTIDKHSGIHSLVNLAAITLSIHALSPKFLSDPGAIAYLNTLKHADCTFNLRQHAKLLNSIKSQLQDLFQHFASSHAWCSLIQEIETPGKHQTYKWFAIWLSIGSAALLVVTFLTLFIVSCFFMPIVPALLFGLLTATIASAPGILLGYTAYGFMFLLDVTLWGINYGTSYIVTTNALSELADLITILPGLMSEDLQKELADVLNHINHKKLRLFLNLYKEEIQEKIDRLPNCEPGKLPKNIESWRFFTSNRSWRENNAEIEHGIVEALTVK